ncbi:MAG TPA: hypothetical protein VK666_13135 [Chryseolinea sp.]|nr:hypothetical protein [Chryseolinea sp.]
MNALTLSNLSFFALMITSASLTIKQPAAALKFSTADQYAIRKIIEDETTAYFNRDSTRLISFYIDEDVTQSVWNSPDGSYGMYKGLKSMRKNFHDAFIKYPDIQPQPNIERTDWFFKPFSDEWAWVNFIQKTAGRDGKQFTNYETRVVKKVNNSWKLVVMYSLGDHGVKSK